MEVWLSSTVDVSCFKDVLIDKILIKIFFFFCSLIKFSLPDLSYLVPSRSLSLHLYFFAVASSSLSDHWFIDLQADSVVNECETQGRSVTALMPLRVQHSTLPTQLFH